MPVPSSYNDVGEDITLRDHVGVVWYDRRFHVPYSWGSTGQRIWLRFSSVHYAAEVVSWQEPVILPVQFTRKSSSLSIVGTTVVINVRLQYQTLRVHLHQPIAIRCWTKGFAPATLTFSVLDRPHSSKPN